MKNTIAILTLAAAVHVCAAEAPQPSPAPAPPPPSPVKEIVVVIKTHFDIGYTHRVKEIVHHYRTDMIDKAMNIMDQSKTLPPEQQFAWTGPGWVMSKVLDDWDGQTPERRKRLDDYVKAGKFQFHALPFTLESDACEPEEMARGFIFSSALCRKYGMPLPRSGKKTDVPSHGGALATVLAHGGVKFMLNFYNNQWNTNFRYWYPGTWSSRVRLWTFDKNTAPDAIMATPALEARNPLLATAANGAGGRLPAEQSGLAVSRKGVLVTAFGQNPDGAGTLLRIWEMAGVSGELTVSLPGTFTSATPVNLRGERTGEPRRIAGSTLAFNLGAFAPATFVLE